MAPPAFSSLSSLHSLSSSSSLSLSALSLNSRRSRSGSVSVSAPSAPAPLQVSCSRQCMLTNKRANNGYSVSFSNRRTKKLQHVNLHWKRIWWPEEQKFVRLKVSAKALRTLEKKPLEKMAKEAGLDLYKHIVGPREMKSRQAAMSAAAIASAAAAEATPSPEQ